MTLHDNLYRMKVEHVLKLQIQILELKVYGCILNALARGFHSNAWAIWCNNNVAYSANQQRYVVLKNTHQTNCFKHWLKIFLVETIIQLYVKKMSSLYTASSNKQSTHHFTDCKISLKTDETLKQENFRELLASLRK